MRMKIYLLLSVNKREIKTPLGAIHAGLTANGKYFFLKNPTLFHLLKFRPTCYQTEPSFPTEVPHTLQPQNLSPQGMKKSSSPCVRYV